MSVTCVPNSQCFFITCSFSYTDPRVLLLPDPTYVYLPCSDSNSSPDLDWKPQIETSKYFTLKLGLGVDRLFSVSAKRYWCKKFGANRLLLPTPLQQAFANKQIVCVEYDSLNDEQEREIFQVCPHLPSCFPLPTRDSSVSSSA